MTKRTAQDTARLFRIREAARQERLVDRANDKRKGRQ